MLQKVWSKWMRWPAILVGDLNINDRKSTAKQWKHKRTKRNNNNNSYYWNMECNFHKKLGNPKVHFEKVKFLHRLNDISTPKSSIWIDITLIFFFFLSQSCDFLVILSTDQGTLRFITTRLVKSDNLIREGFLEPLGYDPIQPN